MLEWEAAIGALAWWPLSTRIGLCDTLSLHFISWTSCIIHLICDLRSLDTIVNCLTRTWMTCAIIISTEAIIFCDTFFFLLLHECQLLLCISETKPLGLSIKFRVSQTPLCVQCFFFLFLFVFMLTCAESLSEPGQYQIWHKASLGWGDWSLLHVSFVWFVDSCLVIRKFSSKLSLEILLQSINASFQVNLGRFSTRELSQGL